MHLGVPVERRMGADKRKGEVFWEPLERILIPNKRLDPTRRELFFLGPFPSCLACWSTGVMSTVSVRGMVERSAKC